MDGYSVTEAASVLGVPTERVWELLARGVLSGAPEGETGMRVYLQPRPAPAAPEPRAANGDGHPREPDRELSPFRELLTEFRNLTERYGQALLALGEARGEVAALRSRVDVLEARMDLRLPSGTTPSAPSWGLPMPGGEEPRVTPPAAAEPQRDVGAASGGGAEPPAPTADEPIAPAEEEPRARARGPRRAIESFAAALARADDPSVPELPGRAEVASTLAALREESIRDVDLPREAAATESISVADEPRAADASADLATQPELATPQALGIEIPADDAVAAADAEEGEAVEVEPDPVEPTTLGPDGSVGEAADGHSITPAGDVAVVEPEADHAVATAPDETGVATPAELASEIDAEAPASAGADVTEPDSTPPVAAELRLEGDPEATVAHEAPPAVAAAEPLEWDAERYTTAIEEPDWFAAELYRAEDVTDGEPESEAPAHVASVPVHGALEPITTAAGAPIAGAGSTADVPTADAEPAAAVPPQPPESPAPADEPEPSRGAGEETVLWFGRSDDPSGASEMEVASQGQRPGRELPGGRDLDEALAALEELRRATSSRTEAAADEWPPVRRAGTDTSRLSSALPATGSPATRAYRRLRRIFPG